MAEEIDKAIEENAKGPKRARSDSVEVEQRGQLDRNRSRSLSYIEERTAVEAYGRAPRVTTCDVMLDVTVEAKRVAA